MAKAVALSQASAAPPRKGDSAAALPEAREGKCTWQTVAALCLVLAAMAATFTYEQDFDAFWHLASGRWMLQNQRVLDFDPFTSDPEDAGAPWVDVYWLFQVVLALVHSIGGFPAITVLQCLLTGAAFAVLAVSLRKHVPAAWLIVAGLAMLPVFAGRIRMRPEMFTLPLMVVSVALLEGVRRGGPARRLWWFVPIMVAWVNMHGLYFLGLILIWGAMAGAGADRLMGRRGLAGNLLTKAALAPLAAATAACLVSPWPLEGFLHPLVLWTRISGQGAYYVYGVSELQRTWSALGSQTEALVLVGLMALAMAANAKRVPLGHLFWLAPVVVLALLAVRNVGLLAPVCGWLLAWHGGCILRRAGRRWKAGARIAAPAAAAIFSLAGLAVAAGYATEYIYHLRRVGTRFGAGLDPEQYSTDLGQYLGRCKAPGDVLTVDFGFASTYIFYSYPARKVWMDGRLEIRSVERFRRHHEIGNELRSRQTADRADLPATVRFLVAGRDDKPQLAAMMQSSRFRLLRVDDAGACFVRSDWRPPPGTAEEEEALPATANLSDFDHPLGADGLVEGVGGRRRTWYRNNPTSINFRLGCLMLGLGHPEEKMPPASAGPLQRYASLLALRYLWAADTEGLLQRDLLRGMLALGLQQWSFGTAQVPSPGLPIDIDLARALCLYRRTNLRGLPDDQKWAVGMMHVRALLQGGHLDSAVEAADAFTQVLSPGEQMNPPEEYRQMRSTLRQHQEEALFRLEEVKREGLSPLQRARRLSSPQMGLSLQAVRELQGTAALDAEARLVLGDLLLRLGRTAEAREQYRAAKGADAATIDLRLALCDWAEGKAAQAEEALSRPDIQQTTAGRMYRAMLLEQMGKYEEALSALPPSSGAGDDSDLLRQIEAFRRRVQEYPRPAR